MSKIKIIERGWPGHFICSYRCTFHRNTLLEKGNIRIVISTVGSMLATDDKNGDKYEEIGLDRYYETMAFKAKKYKMYWDADVTKEVKFYSNWCVDHIGLGADQEANEMHEEVVRELTESLRHGKEAER